MIDDFNLAKNLIIDTITQIELAKSTGNCIYLDFALSNLEEFIIDKRCETCKHFEIIIAEGVYKEGESLKRNSVCWLTKVFTPGFKMKGCNWEKYEENSN